jgi:DNA-binding GntR family transcriptional regulator
MDTLKCFAVSLELQVHARAKALNFAFFFETFFASLSLLFFFSEHITQHQHCQTSTDLRTHLPFLQSEDPTITDHESLFSCLHSRREVAATEIIRRHFPSACSGAHPAASCCEPFVLAPQSCMIVASTSITQDSTFRTCFCLNTVVS